MKNKTIFLTGASGNMGHEGFKHLLERRDRFNIVALVLPTKKDRQIMSAYEGMPGVKLVWGDLTNYDDVLNCVTGTDYVLHVGGMVSPAADYYPELTTKVNIGSVQNIVKAIKAQPNADSIKLVYIGTVAQTGDRNPPIHWGRIGDPIKISKYDNYAFTKTLAERVVIESGLRYWVSLRQTGILHHSINNSLDPIIFHIPMGGVFEWVTAKDSGRLLANVCEDEVPEEFWKRIYNIGGGKDFRIVNYEFIERAGKSLGLSNVKKVFELNWFATQNFHGQWYEDSDILEDYLHFRSGSIENHFLEAKQKSSSFKNVLASLIPYAILKNYVMKGAAYKKNYGTMHWINHNIQDQVKAYFGSKDAWNNIPHWDHFKVEKPSIKPYRLSHGYKETKPLSSLSLNDLQEAAFFRGGSCTSSEMKDGDWLQKLTWTCAFGHSFEASPKLVLHAGHWCPQCLQQRNYDEEAKRNFFFAQVWNPLIQK